jgi:hypothetical protein
MLKAGCNPFLMKPNPLLKYVSERAIREFKLRRFVVAKDRFGKKLYDKRSYVQPEISAAFALEHIWDPLNPICKLECKGLCKDGIGEFSEYDIKRLHR